MISRRQPSLIRVGGSVSEVSSTWCKVDGLSQLAKLGDCISADANGQEMLAEVVHVDVACSMHV